MNKIENLIQKLEKRDFLLEFRDKDTGILITKLTHDYPTMCAILKTLNSNVRVTIHAIHNLPKIEVEN